MTTAPLTLVNATGTQNFLIWTNRGLELLWLLTVVLVPLAFVSRGELISASAIAYLEVPKIALLRTLVGLMAVLWLLEWGIQGRFVFPSLTGREGLLSHPAGWLAALRSWLCSQPRRWLFLAVILFMATALISTALSASRSVSIWGEVPGEDGYAAYTVLAYVVLFGIVATHLRTRPQLWRLVGAIVFMGVLVASYAVVQNYGYDPFDLRFPPNTSRSTSTMGNSILAGAVLLMTISISLTAATISLRGSVRTVGFWIQLVLWALILTIQLMGIIFVQSRGPWIGTAVSLGLLLGLVALLVSWQALVRTTLLLTLAAVLAIGVVYLPLQLPGDRADPAIEAEAARPDPGVRFQTSTLISDRFTSLPQQLASSGISDRVDIWKNSWQLMVYRPWFDFDSLSLSFLRPVVGYGPDLFRYVYMLESPPRGGDLLPRESAHAHNFFIHQGVESGVLGLLSSLGIFVVPLALGGYLLIRQRRNYSTVHKLILIGLLATLVGRSLEQMVGLARVSDLIIFWVLLGAFAALPIAMKTSRSPGESSDAVGATTPGLALGPSSGEGNFDWQRALRLLLVALLVTGIGALTWVKTISYPRAAVIAAKAAEQSRDGDLQGALSSYDRAIELASDVWINYNRRAAVYYAYWNSDQEPKASECRLQSKGRPYETCLVEKVYSANLGGVKQRPYNFRAHHTLAGSALELATANGEPESINAALQFSRETVDLVPNAWPLYNQLAFTHVTLAEAEAALDPLKQSLNMICS